MVVKKDSYQFYVCHDIIFCEYIKVTSVLIPLRVIVTVNNNWKIQCPLIERYLFIVPGKCYTVATIAVTNIMSLLPCLYHGYLM